MRRISSIHTVLSFVLFLVGPSIVAESGIVYKNPCIYNIEYSFEMFPDPNKIDRSKDLKLWIPIPGEWDSQKAAKIISVEPEPHGKYVDPEYGNHMLFWDFGKESEKPSYRVNLKYRLKSYELYADIDPNKVGSYDKTSDEYALYTRSTYRINITPEVKKLAEEAIGGEQNPYLQAKRICEFVNKKIRFKHLRSAGASGITYLLESGAKDPSTGEYYYEGECDQYSAFFVALCRAVGIPARSVLGFVSWAPWMTVKDLKIHYEHLKKLTPDGLAAARIYGALWGHVWAEFYAPNYGWIPVDPTDGVFGQLHNACVIASKGRDIAIGPNLSPEDEGYGDQWILLHDGRADVVGWGIWNIAKISIAKVTILHHSDPFPADAFAAYISRLHRQEQYRADPLSYRKRVLTWICNKTQNEQDKAAALAKAYSENPGVRENHEQYILHMFRQVVGEEKFLDICESYMELLDNSEEAVTTRRFREIAENIYGEPLVWFFEQWVDYTELPQLGLNDISVSEDGNIWHVTGRLSQLGDIVFKFPVQLKIETEGQSKSETIFSQARDTLFNITVADKPKSIILDPDHHILKIQGTPVISEKL